MTHLILCREYPPAPYPAGGIGAYTHHIAHLLAQAGETVHVIAQRWDGAPSPITTSIDGRLILHRIALDETIPGDGRAEQQNILRLLARSTCPTQLFSWQAARYAERLFATEPIDVIEAPEWEAPLYYLQARRAVGLGPERKPPCIVHLHSPTQMIFEHNDWDRTLTDYLPLIRFEEFSIRNADALLCPSHYLAGQVATLFDFKSSLGAPFIAPLSHAMSGPTVDSIEIIPLPVGDETPLLERSPEVWARDVIAYVGRLELRKGIVEWVDAAVSVASTHPTVSFDFFGSDTLLGGGAGPSVLRFLRQRIPRPLRPRFRFHGGRSRTELMAALAQVALAVVPSRWENFPLSCVEAMSTGLPVLATPNGGMAEMIVDNQSGWIATECSAEALATTLRRALATPPTTRAVMGARAAHDIRLLCENAAVIASHIAFRNRVASSPNSAPLHTGATKPWTLYGKDDLDPGPHSKTLTWPGPPIAHAPPRKQPRRRYSGMALIANQSASFSLRWLLGLPLRDKLRWLTRHAANPQRLARWLAWRARAMVARPVSPPSK